MLRWLIASALDRLFRSCSVSKLYRNKYGIKYLNQLIKSKRYEVIERKILDYKELYLGFDGLKDKYSLLDTRIDNSPHFELMRIIDENKSIINSEYGVRLSKGALDNRRAIRISRKYEELMKNKFAERKKQVLAQEYSPVQIYYLNNKYYIADGKHRAALSAYLDMPVVCDIISRDFLSDSYRQWIFEKMNNQKEFGKHFILFNALEHENS